MKISIIGAGKVGSTIVYSLLSQKIGNELILLDLNADLVSAEAEDLGHAGVVLNPDAKVIGTTDNDNLKDSDVIVITAGRARKEGETREQLFETNSKIITSICKTISDIVPDAIVLIVTNPPEELAKIACETCANKIIAMAD
ncbi:MAG: lactate/malate family dehydrogenase, partial [Candidatus Heimdallarchaeota archaeon]